MAKAEMFDHVGGLGSVSPEAQHEFAGRYSYHIKASIVVKALHMMFHEQTFSPLSQEIILKVDLVGAHRAPSLRCN